MKTLLLAGFFLVGSVMTGFAQTDHSSILSGLESRLKTGQLTVSALLTDKNFLPLHPETPFRELIKKYSSPGILSIATAEEPGKRIKVVATVKDQAGKPVPGALIYLYQTDARGWYAGDAPHVLKNEGDMRHARLFGYAKTDKDGRIELHTVKPSGYPQSDLPAHIHVHVSAEGYDPFGTEFLFDDDERLKGKIREQAVNSRFLIAKPEKIIAPFDQQFSYTMLISKQ